MNRERQGGFSLIELLVAMAITLIVSGAIYGLLTGGQNAFRREPELTERQQNIRLGMDMIMRDVANAGAGLPPFVQLFTTGLELDAGSPGGPSGLQSDALEMLTNTGQESEPVCVAPNNGANNGRKVFLTRSNVPTLNPADPAAPRRLVFLIFSSTSTTGAEDSWTSRRLTAQSVAPEAYDTGVNPGLEPPNCTNGTLHATLTFDNTVPANPASLCALANLPPVGNFSGACNLQAITRVAFANQVRYQIRNDASDGVPVLQRISTEDGVVQTLARGIEELQVQYTTVAAPTVWLDGAPAVAAPPGPTLPVLDASYGTLINQVRVTLTSRSEAQNMQGASTGAGATGVRLRGSLVSTSSPRAVLMHIARGRPSPGPSPLAWYWE
jgi:prepilin-type N-terminal cleavage/methylation domain-containing protein